MTPMKIVVMSLKGGTGKTTVCLGLASALRDRGMKTGLLDVDIHASALPRALGLTTDPGYQAVSGRQLRPLDFDGFQVWSIGLLFAEETPNMWDGATKREAVQQIATTSIAWSPDLAWVVVDTPPTSGDEIQSLLANMADVYGAVIVCQPNDLAVLAIAKTLEVLREMEVPVCGLVANMVGYRCPNCGYVSNPFDRDTEDVRGLADRFGVPFLGTVPFGPESMRQPAMAAVTDAILGQAPVMLKNKKGGFRRWLVAAALK